MGSVNSTTAAMPHAHAPTTGASATAGSHGAHIEPRTPRSGDPRFVDGSVGEFGQSKTIVQPDGPAYGGRKVEKNQNGNDKKQNNYGVTDANFTGKLGVIADPDTGKPHSYAQTIQAYNAAGAIETQYPKVYAKLVANQDAGRGTVLGGALAILGVTRSDGAGGASLRDISDAEVGQIRGATLGELGSLREYVLETEDFKGREWNRAHHPGSSWKGMTELVRNGYGWDQAALLTGDSLTSWSGRVLGSNNQDGSKTGFAADELAGLKYLVLTEQATGTRALEAVLGAHADTHLPEDKLTDPKINALIGLPKGFRPKTPEEIAMVAGRLRQWALDPTVEVNRGEFDKFVKAGLKTDEGRALASSGLLGNVRFKVNPPKAAAAAPAAAQAAPGAPVAPTGMGTAPTPAIAGGGAMAPVLLGGSNTIDTRPALSQLGLGGPFRVIDPATGGIDRRLNDQLMAAFLDTLAKASDSALLGDDDERSAFADGARKGMRFMKDAISGAPAKIASLKAELTASLADGRLSAAERATLGEALGEDGMAAVDAATADGVVSERELAVLHENLDGAASARLERDLGAAVADGAISAQERDALLERVGAGSLDALTRSIADGTVTGDELSGIAAEVGAHAGSADAAAGCSSCSAGAPDIAGGGPTADAAAGAAAAAPTAPSTAAPAVGAPPRTASDPAAAPAPRAPATAAA